MTPSSSSSSQWTWNWDWNCGPALAAGLDPAACSGCNTTISVRVLSPGDDGPVIQSMVSSSTSVAKGISSTLQLLAQTAGTAVPPPPASITDPSGVPNPPVPELSSAPPGTPSTLPVGIGAVSVVAVDVDPATWAEGQSETPSVDEPAAFAPEDSASAPAPSVEIAPQDGPASHLAPPAATVTVAPARVAAAPEPVRTRAAHARRAASPAGLSSRPAFRTQGTGPRRVLSPRVPIARASNTWFPVHGWETMPGRRATLPRVLGRSGPQRALRSRSSPPRAAALSGGRPDRVAAPPESG